MYLLVLNAQPELLAAIAVASRSMAIIKTTQANENLILEAIDMYISDIVLSYAMPCFRL